MFFRKNAKDGVQKTSEPMTKYLGVVPCILSAQVINDKHYAFKVYIHITF